VGVKTKKEVDLWLKRIQAGKGAYEAWERQYRVAECYQYWKGNQRDEPWDGSDRKAQHNKIHPEVSKNVSSLYFYRPFGRVIVRPERADTPKETLTRKAQLLQDTGVFLVRNEEAGFLENTSLAVKESEWACGLVEVGYSPDFIDNPAAKRPPLREKETTELLPAVVRDEFGLTPESGSDLPSLQKELQRLRGLLRGEVFYVKHIPSNQILFSPSDRPVLEDNDWVGYWEVHNLEDVKDSTLYENTDDLKPSTKYEASEENGSVDRVMLYKLWDLRTKTRIVLAEGHDDFLLRKAYSRCGLKFLRRDVDPYHFLPVPPVYLKLPSQDGYNDSAEYLRKMRISTVPRYTYDDDAVTPEEAAKFQSRDMNVMIPRKGGTHQPIEPVNQPSMSEGAIRTLALSEKEFSQAGSTAGDPLSPPTQTATRAVIANAEKTAEQGSQRGAVARWLSSIIQEMILLAVDNMNMDRWIAANVDLDSPMALDAIVEVAETYQQINAEKLRDAMIGIKWNVEVEAETLSPVSEAEMGLKMMQVVKYITEPGMAMLLSKAPALLKRMLSLGGIRGGSDVDAIKEALGAVVQMNMEMLQRGAASPPGHTPMPGEAAGPVPAVSAAASTETQLPVPPGVAGA
jgi:hypothetical protein